jgi:hypothetical protein
MSKTTAAAVAAAPEAAPAPVWVVLRAWLSLRKPDGLALDLGPGRLVRVDAETAERLIMAETARPATRDDMSIGEGQARDLTTGGYTYA